MRVANRCSMRVEVFESTARQYEAAARDEEKVAVARSNVESQYNMNTGAQQLESQTEAIFTQHPLGSLPQLSHEANQSVEAQRKNG